jgi:hypothetical protein
LTRDPSKIKSILEIFIQQTILIKILISYYEDRKEIGEEDVDVELKSKRQIMCLCL